MSKYRNRSGKAQILTSKELSGFADLLIQVSLGNVDVVFPETNNSNPSPIVCLNPVKPIPYQRSFIGATQWSEVLKPVVEKISPLIGNLPTKGSLIEVRDTVIGRTALWEGSMGSLFVPDEIIFIDLVQKLIIQQATTKGYGV